VAELPPDVVLGRGSLGTLFAVLLAHGKRPVHVVSRRAETSTETTLAVTGPFDREATVTVRPDVPERARLAIVATRADAALDRAREAEPAPVDEGAIVALQNGLVSLDVADAIGPDRVLPTIVGLNASLVEDRTVEIASIGPTTTGALDPAAEPAVDALEAGLGGPVPFNRTDNPQGAVWSKWCISCAINGLALVTGESLGAITNERAGREALVALMSECVRVAEAEGVQLERVAGPFSPDSLAGRADRGLGGWFRRTVAWFVGRGHATVTPSSIDAYRGGRNPELDALNREAVRRAREHGLDAPYNETLAGLAEQIVDRRAEPSLRNLEALTEQPEKRPEPTA